MNKTSLFLGLTGGLTLLLLLVVASHAVPFGMPRVWAWEYHALGAPQRVLLSLFGLAAVTGALLGPVRRLLGESPTRRSEGRALAALWLAGVVMAISTALMHPGGFMQMATLIINPASNSYYSTALQQPDAPELLRDYDVKMRGFVSHAQTQSAGPVALSGLLRRAFTSLPGLEDIADTFFAISPGVNSEFIARYAARWWQVSLSRADAGAALMIAFFLIGLGSLAVAPIYFLGKWLYDANIGIWAAVGFTLLPSFHLFTPSVDQMYPLVTAVALCLGMLASRSARNGWGWMGFMGLWLSVAVFMNMGLVVLVPLCALFTILRLGQQDSVRPDWKWVPAFVFGLVAPWFLLRLLLGYDLLAVFHASDELRNALYARQYRSYSLALVGNLVDFFAFAGVPVALLFAWRLAGAGRGLVRRSASLVDSLTAEPLLWAFMLVLIALELSGKTRGEVARMWMFLTPCVLLTGAAQARAVMAASEIRPHVRAGTLITLQFVHIVVFQYFVRVWGY